MNKKRIITFIVSFLIFLIFILTTSPYHMPLIFVIVPGVAFIIAIHSLLAIAVGYLPVRQKVGRTIVLVLTIILAVIAVLLSVGQLAFRDFALLLALALIGTFYITRLRDT